MGMVPDARLSTYKKEPNQAIKGLGQMAAGVGMFFAGAPLHAPSFVGRGWKQMRKGLEGTPPPINSQIPFLEQGMRTVQYGESDFLAKKALENIHTEGGHKLVKGGGENLTDYVGQLAYPADVSRLNEIMKGEPEYWNKFAGVAGGNRTQFAKGAAQLIRGQKDRKNMEGAAKHIVQAIGEHANSSLDSIARDYNLSRPRAGEEFEQFLNRNIKNKLGTEEYMRNREAIAGDIQNRILNNVELQMYGEGRANAAHGYLQDMFGTNPNLGTADQKKAIRNRNDEELYENYMMAQKDFRNELAVEEIETLQKLAKELGTPIDVDQAIHYLNDPQTRYSEKFQQALAENPSFVRRADTGLIQRQRNIYGSNLLGEGQFGKVISNDDGTVTKYIPPVVEFGNLPDGSIAPARQGRLYGPDAALQEAVLQGRLGNKGMAPKIHSFDFQANMGANPFNPIRIKMDDFRDNFVVGEDFEATATPREISIANIKRAQQEAQAATMGIFIGDRHSGNYAVNKMTGNPIQLDIGMAHEIAGSDRDAAMIMTSAKGMQAAGLWQEADLLLGLGQELQQKGDVAGLHDLAQQSVASVMKIKKPVGKFNSRMALAPSGTIPF